MHIRTSAVEILTSIHQIPVLLTLCIPVQPHGSSVESKLGAVNFARVPLKRTKRKYSHGLTLTRTVMKITSASFSFGIHSILIHEIPKTIFLNILLELASEFWVVRSANQVSIKSNISKPKKMHVKKLSNDVTGDEWYSLSDRLI